MVWDKTRPSGSAKINTLDNLLQDNNAALETALDLEHTFQTGGTQTGRHQFGVGTTAARFSPTGLTGAVYFNTDRVAGEVVIDVSNAGVWVETDYGLTDVSQKWTETQYTTYVDFTVDTVPTPYEANWDATAGNFRKLDMTGNTIINNPSPALPAQSGASFVFQINQGAGGHSLTFGTDFVEQWGAQPDVNQGAGTNSFVYVTLRRDGKYVYSVSHNS